MHVDMCTRVRACAHVFTHVCVTLYMPMCISVVSVHLSFLLDTSTSQRLQVWGSPATYFLQVTTQRSIKM